MSRPAIVLASGSSVRRDLLVAAGVEVVVDAADIDERHAEGETAFLRGRRLAREKALVVSARHPGQLVLGCDQTGEIKETLVELEKPTDAAAARAQLAKMAGRTHRFFAFGALVRDGVVIAEVVEEANIALRALTTDEIAAHVATGEWRGSCGGYQIEHRGITLVERMDGSYHGVLGLPLVAVLHALRAHAQS